MKGALVILIVLIAAGILLWIFDGRHRAARPEDTDKNPEPQPSDASECCGMHIVCEKDTLIAFNSDTDYYDDEELDRFAGRDSASYTPEETDEFREVLYTLRPDEVAPWSRSITARGIALPDAVRDEVIILVEERRRTLTTQS